jgi:hypothetical protein
MAEATNPLRVRRIKLRHGLQDEGYATVSCNPPTSKPTIRKARQGAAIDQAAARSPHPAMPPRRQAA